jgi:hypothetical protein
VFKKSVHFFHDSVRPEKMAKTVDRDEIAFLLFSITKGLGLSLQKRQRERAADDPPHFFLVMTVCVRRTRASRASDSGSRSRASTALCWVQKKVRREKKKKKKKKGIGQNYNVENQSFSP